MLDKLRKAANASPKTDSGLSSTAEAVERCTYTLELANGTTKRFDGMATTDEAQADERYEKTIAHRLYQTGCCGLLVTLERTSDYDAPGGVCLNCATMLCKKHAAEPLACSACGKTLCRRCRFVKLKMHGLFFCEEHADSAEVDEWVKANIRALANAGYAERS